MVQDPLSGSLLCPMDVTWLTSRATQGSRLCLLYGVNFASQGHYWAACSQNTCPRLCPQEPTGARLVPSLPRDHPDPEHAAQGLPLRPWSLSTHGPPFKIICSIPYLAASGETESHKEMATALGLRQVSTSSLALEHGGPSGTQGRGAADLGRGHWAVAVLTQNWLLAEGEECLCVPTLWGLVGWGGPRTGPWVEPLGMVTALPFRGPCLRCALGAGHQEPHSTVDTREGHLPATWKALLVGPLLTRGHRSNRPASTTGPDPAPLPFI